MKYLRVWWLTASRSAQTAFQSRFGALIFILGKILRFVLFLIFLILLTSNSQTLANYSLWQVIFFFSTYNLIDSITQLFLRDVYRFRSYVIYGNFDYFLTRPISPLFRSLFGGSDILDVPMLLIAIAFIAVSAAKIGPISLLGVILYLVLILNGLAISLAFHILTIAIGVLTTEVDNTIMLYRDLTQMGRIPTEVYRQPLSWFITYIIPVGVMMTFPAKALMGLLNWQFIIIAFATSAVVLSFSMLLWRYSLFRYSSVSS